MCHSIKIDKDWRMAQVKAWGKVNSHELKDIFIETVEHPDWDAGFSMLCDYNEILNFDVTSNDIYNIIEWQESIDAMIGDGRCAVVADRDLVYGMTRMWQILSSNRSQQVCVFRQMNNAITWLGSTFGQ
jgi:hypothetical protein